jgi:hypothetical protein
VDDDLDAELRRLFSDDRLDVHVTPDATGVVLRGANRRRRRRTAVTAAFVLVALVGAGAGLTQLRAHDDDTAGEVLPTSISSSSAPPPPSVSTITLTSTVTVDAPPPGSIGSVPGNSGTSTPGSVKLTTTTPPSAPPAEAGKVGKLALGMAEADALKTGSLVEPGTSTNGCTAYATTTVADSDAVIISPAKGIVRLTLPSYVKTQRNIGVGSKVADVKTAYPTATQNGSTLLVEMAATPQWTYVFGTDGAAVTSIRMRLAANDCPSV